MGTATATILASGPGLTWYGVTIALLVGATLSFWRAWRLRWEIVDTPTSTCRGVFVGRNEVVGQAVPTQPIRSPLQGVPCVWFEWHLEHYVHDDDGGSWSTTEKRSTAAPFWLQDETGRVLVRPRGAQVEATGSGYVDLRQVPWSRWQLRQWALVGEDLREREISLRDASFVEQPTPGGFLKSDTASPVGALKGRNRISERVVPVGQPTYLLGGAVPRADGGGLELSVGEGRTLLISNKDEAGVAKAAGRSTAWSLLVSLALSAVLAGMLSATFAHEVRPSWSITTVLVELAVLFAVYATKVFNRLVAVKQQAAKAWSMIDVSLRRRHDLLPNLAAVAQQYAAHEQQVQEAAAALRSGVDLPPQEELPTDASLRSAEAADRSARSRAGTVFALAESAPDLKASDVYLDLQRRIVDAENLVESSRRFYNDAITVLRDRRQTFPGNLLAPFVKVPSWELFEAEEAASEAPTLDLDPTPAPDLGPQGAGRPAPGPAAPPTSSLPPPPPSGGGGSHLPPPPPPPGPAAGETTSF